MKNLKIIYFLTLSLLLTNTPKVFPFKQAHLELAKSGCKNLQNLDLKDAPLQNCNLVGADFKNSLLYNANLSNANLSHTKLNYCDLRKANLTKADLRFSELNDATLEDAILIEANLNLASAQKTKFIHSDCHNAKFRGAELNYANFCLANLKKANLCFAKSINTSFRNAILKKAILAGIKANNAIFTDANMQKVLMPFATLTGAYFINTKLQNSNLMLSSFRDVQSKEGFNITGSILFRGPIITNGYNLLIEVTATSNTESNITVLGIQPTEIDISNIGLDDLLEQPTPEIKDFKRADSPLNKPLVYADKCPICRESFNDLQQIAALQCGHTLCPDCANHTLSYKKECPLCRARTESFREISFIKK